MNPLDVYVVKVFIKSIGYIGPGGLDHRYYEYHGGFYHNTSKCTGGSARYIDILVFGREHIYNHPTAEAIYYTTEPYDPEGLLGKHCK